MTQPTLTHSHPTCLVATRRPEPNSRIYCRRSDASHPQRFDQAPRNQILVGDVVDQLARLPDSSIDTIVTSPPYHLLRRYGGGTNEIGTEVHIDDYVTRVVAVCDELARVLKPSGSLWLNLGDSFSRGPRYGAPPKALLLAPERILVALAGRGWRARSKVIWAKSTHLPASVRDRLTMSWEPLYHLVRSRNYYFDLDAIRVPHTSHRHPARPASRPGGYDATKPQWAGPLAGANDGIARLHAEGRVGHPLGKNPGDVWRMATANFRGAHFAVFPEQLVTRPILATCPASTCTTCGSPWTRPPGHPTAPLNPTCACGGATQPGLVLDPFLGSGTVGVAATHLGRHWLGIELNPDFAELARTRITATAHRPGTRASPAA